MHFSLTGKIESGSQNSEEIEIAAIFWLLTSDFWLAHRPTAKANNLQKLYKNGGAKLVLYLFAF